MGGIGGLARWRRLAAVVGVGLVVAGCGGTRHPGTRAVATSTTERAATDAEMAQMVLLQPADLPAGWSVARRDPVHPPDPVPAGAKPACAGQPDGIDETALGGVTYRGRGGQELSVNVIVYGTATAARREGQWTESAAGAACSESLLRRAFSSATVRWIPRSPSDPVPVRGVIETATEQRGPSGGVVRNTSRAVRLERGRFSISLVFSVESGPLDPSLERQVVAAGADRLLHADVH